MRLGGIYALERIAKDSKKDHWAIMEILTAYVREHAKSNDKERQHVDLNVPTDIPAILTTLGRRKRASEKGQYQQLDLRGVNLNGADLAETHFEGALFTEARLERAKLRSAYLKEANFGRANLERASLLAAHLEGANLCDANLKGAWLAFAKLNGAILCGAHLEGARLNDTKLSWEQIEGAVIDDTTELPPALAERRRSTITQRDKATI